MGGKLLCGFYVGEGIYFVLNSLLAVGQLAILFEDRLFEVVELRELEFEFVGFGVEGKGRFSSTFIRHNNIRL